MTPSNFYDLVTDRYASSPDPVIRYQVGTSHLNKAQILSDLGRGPDALSNLEAVIALFARSDHPLEVELVERAKDLQQTLEGG